MNLKQPQNVNKPFTRQYKFLKNILMQKAKTEHSATLINRLLWLDILKVTQDVLLLVLNGVKLQQNLK